MKPRIFLVDDEQPVLDGLSATIRKFFPDADICGFAKSGRDAVAGVSREKPDIVLMDVRMPGMSGLDALRELKRLAPDTLPILLTAYERFDIAREAFSLGVYDYLVKPVEQETLVQAVRGALERHAERQEAAMRACAARNELELARPLLEEGFIYSLIFADADDLTIRAYADRLGLAEPAGFMAVIGRRGRNLPDLSIERAEARELRAEIEYRTPCIVGAPHRDFLPVFFPGPDTESAIAALGEALAAMKEPVFHAGIGSPRAGKELRISWAEATADLGTTEDGEQTESEDPANTALIATRDGDLAAATAAFRNSVERYEEIGALAALAGAMVSAYGGDSRTILTVGKEIGCVVGSRDANDSSKIVTMLATALAESVASDAGNEQTGDRDRRVRSTLAFIAESYEAPISLENAAERVELSAARLSRLLAAQTGKSFTEHLTDTRIRRAKEELEAGSKSIKEIAAVCGYPDANYFSRAFKKIVGLTPSDYANRHGRSIV